MADGSSMMDDDYESPESYAMATLGAPEQSFRVSPKRFGAKFALGGELLLYGAVGNYLAWHWGLWNFDHITLLVLFAPPLTGLSILRKLFAARGLAIHIYPQGILRLQRSSVLSIPWDELAEIYLNAEVVRFPMEHDSTGQVTGIGALVTAPAVRLDRASITLKRNDGDEITLNATIERYPELVQEIFQRSFPSMFRKLLTVLNGESEPAEQNFGTWTASAQGLTIDERVIPWRDIHGFVIGNKIMTVSYDRKGKPEQDAVTLESIPNPHLLLALHATMQQSFPA